MVFLQKRIFVLICLIIAICCVDGFASSLEIYFKHTAPNGKVKYRISADFEMPRDDYKEFIKVSYKKFEDSDDNYVTLHEFYKGTIKKKWTISYYHLSKDITDTFLPGKYKIRIELWRKSKANGIWLEPVHNSYYDKEIIVNSDLIGGSFYDEPLVLSDGNFKIGYGIQCKNLSIINASLEKGDENSYPLIEVTENVFISNSQVLNISISKSYNNPVLESFIIKDSTFNNSSIFINAKKIDIENNKFLNKSPIELKPYNFYKIIIRNNVGLSIVMKQPYYNRSKNSGNVFIDNNDNLTFLANYSYMNKAFFWIKNNKINKLHLYLDNLSVLKLENNVISYKYSFPDFDNYVISDTPLNLEISNSKIENNIISSYLDNFYGGDCCLRLTGDNNKVENNTIYGKCVVGVELIGNNNLLNRNTIFSNQVLMTPIELNDVSNSIIEKNNLDCGGKKTTSNYNNTGILIYRNVVNCKILNNLVDNCTYGFQAYTFNKCLEGDKIINNEISGNEFHSYKNKISGCFKENKFYNNFIDAEIGYWQAKDIIFPYNEFNCGDKDCENEWFISPVNKTNIVGGPSIGGNYWKYFKCTDPNKDGFCDDEYKFVQDGKTYILDKYPLFRNKLIIVPGIYNPVNRGWSNKKEPVKIIQVRISNNNIPKGSANIKSLKFKYKGTGEVSDIEKVIFYEDPLCKFKTGLIKKGEGNFKDNEIIFNVNKVLPENKEICYVLEYVINEAASKASIIKSDYCPCATYGAEILSKDAKIEVNEKNFDVMGYVKGSINASIPEIELTEEDNYRFICGKNQETGGKLSVKLDEFVKDECFGKWNAKFKIEEVPEGANGAIVKYGTLKGKEIEVPFNNNGIAEAKLICGDKKGEYIIGVYAVPSANNTLNCPELMPEEPAVTFEVTEVEPVLNASLDGSESGTGDEVLSTYISTIDAVNKLSTEVELPLWSPKIKSVSYEPDWTSSITVSSAPYKAEINMKGSKEESQLIQKIEFEDSTIIEKKYSVYAIELPEWTNTFNGFPYKGITFGFNEENKSYELNFSFPDDFAWSNPIPDSIALIGGEENEEKFSCEANAFYYLTEETGFKGKGSFSGTLLGHEAEAEGEIGIYFDREFNVKENPAPYGKFSGNIDFEIEPKTLGSKTVLIYGVPVTVTVEAGGNIKIFAEGKLVFHKTLKLKEVGFIPGITVVLSIDASVSAAMGLAKVGVTASPTGTIKIKLKYTTEEGKVIEEAFGGEFSVPVTVYGSLFYDLAEADLAETEFGPWKFGDEVGSAGYIKNSMIRKSSNGKFYSTGATAVNETGKVVRIFIQPPSYNSSDTTVSYDFSFGSESSLENYYPNNNWEIDPSVTFLSGDKVLALWTSNDGSKDLKKLNEIFNHQDIAYAYYNGSKWEKQGYVIKDENADGSSKVSYDGYGKAMAVWIHNREQGEEYTLDKRKFSIYYALFYEESKEWSSAVVIPDTDKETGDFMVDVVGMGENKFMVLWIRDIDGKLYNILDKVQKGSNVDTTNKDCNVVYSIYDNGKWSEIKSLTSANNFTELMVRGAFNKKTEELIAVWVSYEVGKKVLYMSKYANEKWSNPLKLDESNYLIEDPVVSINDNHIATIVYRKFTGKSDGLYRIEKNLGEISGSEIKVEQLTEGTNMWNSSSIGKDGKVFLGWTDVKNTGKVKSAEYENINSKIKEDNLSVSGYDNSPGKWKGIKLIVPLLLGKSGKYKVKAVLYKGEEIIAKGESEVRDYNEGESEAEIIFSGRYIKSSLIDGPYQIGEIKLYYFNPNEIIVYSSKVQLTTGNYSYKDFIEGVLELDNKIYYGENAKIKITVNDNVNTAEVCITNSIDNSSKIIKLDNKENGKFEKDVGLEGITLEEGCLIFVTYVDGEKNIFRKSAIWIENPSRVYDLTVKLDNYIGKNMVKGLEGGINCPNNCYESIAEGTEVTLKAIIDNESEFIGWEGADCDNSSTECSFTMDNNTEIKAYFKKIDYIEDSTGEVEKENVKVKRVMQINKGWQLVSIPVEKQYNIEEKFIQSRSVWSWTGGKWRVWSSDEKLKEMFLKYKVEMLENIESGKGYWLNSEGKYNENFNGLSYGKEKIEIGLGWNLLGIGVKVSPEIFEGINTLWKWSEDRWRVWSSKDSIKKLLEKYKIEEVKELKAGEGFWINK